MDEETWPATQRPSRIREVQAGRLSWTSVDVLDLEGGDGRPLRDALESFGVQVNYLPIGQPRHFVAALDGSRTVAPYVILCCHGDEGRVLLDELAPEIAAHQPFNGSAGPEDVRAHLRLPGSVVINNGCDTGDPRLAEAFLDAGASAYIAPSGAPFGYASVFAPLFLFYELTEQRTLTEAVTRLRAHDGELGMWEMRHRH
ncbi:MULTISPECIES: hypothetical protein [Streptomyces]|uniref:CHAT domain-containing protein n=3 Tax=Streptomyces rimosus TaxID=1927 RepID=L8EL04_STRR1|nr:MULTISPECIES: hypothetical protein [Streptomyces]KOG72760.1 hypothetical protein ADK78_18430 [Kitasatospora aureofaciens]MYT46605.1 hypothetical protein [Streptomyces sp. SID5471]KEF04511.1 hypothetical protein DF17_23420 [Streptomyces rimosus]KEF20094.1 hypothetical protein DF18_14950 [Streptomyces rimosus]KOT34057.1 hypothetical protein ADK84_24890 [Streptomyces sp. NRRL WC-3701]